MEQQRLPRAAGSRLHPRRLDAAYIGVLQTVVGIWLFISPVVFLAHPGSHTRALVNFMAVGGVMVVTGILAGVRAAASTQLARTVAQRRWTWLWAIVALWLLISPWVIGYSDQRGLTINAVLCAVVLAVLAALNWWFTNRMGPDHHRGIVPPSGRVDVQP